MNYYRTRKVAELVNVHPNTVRLYEEWGFISPVPREQNGYRQFSDLHVLQIRIARLAFRQEFIQNDLRKRATRIVRLSGKEEFKEALDEAGSFYRHLKAEHTFTLQAIGTVNDLLRKDNHTPTTYSHSEVSEKLNLTKETLRNWERNGLYEVNRDARNRRIYSNGDLQKLLIIRTLRSAHFSIASIRHLFEEIDASRQQVDILTILNSPKFTEDFLHVTDQLELNLKRAMNDVKTIITLLRKMVITAAG